MSLENEKVFYDSTKHLLDVYDRESRTMRFDAASKDEFETWKIALRNKFREISGMSRMETCELLPQILEKTKMEGYTREKIIIQTEPDVWMPVYVLIPESPGGKCVIAAHGHASGGKYCVAGCYDIPAVKEQVEKLNYAYGVDFVKRGFIVFCPDARGFGERREWTLQNATGKEALDSTCNQLNRMAICLGLSLGGMWAWDLERLVDYIETRSDCDMNRLGCVGLSGGGYQTLMLTALDDRIKCAVSSGYFYGIRDALLKLSNNCDCNYIPNLWRILDMGDLGALIAPRPLLIETGTEDDLNGERGIANVSEQLDITRAAYRLFDAEDMLEWFVFEGGHVWNGEKTYDFVERHLVEG